VLLKNANIVTDGNNTRRVHIFVENGKIVNIFENSIPENIPQNDVIDCSNFVVFPGFIDAHVHFDDPGYTDREDFLTGTMSAAKGGVTTVVDMPCTSIPEVITKENLQYKLDIVSKKQLLIFLFGEALPLNKSIQESTRKL
jgi:Dihydroorotase and related cyclic amidohydrolases